MKIRDIGDIRLSQVVLFVVLSVVAWQAILAAKESFYGYNQESKLRAQEAQSLADKASADFDIAMEAATKARAEKRPTSASVAPVQTAQTMPTPYFPPVLPPSLTTESTTTLAQPTSISESPVSPRGVMFVESDDGEANLRPFASTENTPVGALHNGSEVAVLYETVNASGQRWLRVSSKIGEGWIVGDLLSSSRAQSPSSSEASTTSLATCGDSPVAGADWFPVFIVNGDLEFIRSEYCQDAISKTDNKTGDRIVQLASFTDKSKAQEFATKVGGEVGEPYQVD